CALYQCLTAPNYMMWYMKISHPYIIALPPGNPLQLAELDAIVQQEQLLRARGQLTWSLDSATSVNLHRN
ncbi:hypothetical protein A2U01_0029640, partial [Trifolium medium]|nr:hypothetical protein [Trifolium medium]